MSAFSNNQYKTELTLANAVELGTKVISKLAGEDISNSIKGKTFEPDEIRSLLTAQMKSVFITRNKGA